MLVQKTYVMKVSICITTYEAGGKGGEFIRHNLEKCLEQTYRPLEIVISDHSKDSIVEDTVRSFTHPEISIVYNRFEEKRGSPGANWNNSVRHATGDWVRILALDDYLAYPDALTDSMKYVREHPEYGWFVSNRVEHGRQIEAYWNPQILRYNTISGPSCALVPRSMYLKAPMHEQLTWVFDLEWYYRLYINAGKPGIIPSYTWVNRIHPNQLTHSVKSRELLEYEMLYAMYGRNLPMSP